MTAARHYSRPFIVKMALNPCITRWSEEIRSPVSVCNSAARLFRADRCRYSTQRRRTAAGNSRFGFHPTACGASRPREDRHTARRARRMRRRGPARLCPPQRRQAPRSNLHQFCRIPADRAERADQASAAPSVSAPSNAAIKLSPPPPPAPHPGGTGNGPSGISPNAPSNAAVKPAFPPPHPGASSAGMIKPPPPPPPPHPAAPSAAAVKPPSPPPPHPAPVSAKPADHPVGGCPPGKTATPNGCK